MASISVPHGSQPTSSLSTPKRPEQLDDCTRESPTDVSHFLEDPAVVEPLGLGIPAAPPRAAKPRWSPLGRSKRGKRFGRLSSSVKPSFKAALVSFKAAESPEEAVYWLQDLGRLLGELDRRDRINMCQRDLQAAIKAKRDVSLAANRWRRPSGIPAVKWTRQLHQEVVHLLTEYFEPSATDALPSCVLQHIFSFLFISKHFDLTLVCSEWEHISSADCIWRPLYKKRFCGCTPIGPPPPRTCTTTVGGDTPPRGGGGGGGGEGRHSFLSATGWRVLHAARRYSSTTDAARPTETPPPAPAQPSPPRPQWQWSSSDPLAVTHDDRAAAESSAMEAPAAVLPSSTSTMTPTMWEAMSQDRERRAVERKESAEEELLEEEQGFNSRECCFKRRFHRRLLDPRVGDRVEVAWRGKFRLEAMDVYQGLAWWVAVVVDKELPGPDSQDMCARYKIHYPGWVSRWDEWVHRNRLRWAVEADYSAPIRVNADVEIWCCGSNVPGAWLEAKVKRVRGLKYDVGRVLSNGSLWVDRERVRLACKSKAGGPVSRSLGNPFVIQRRSLDLLSRAAVRARLGRDRDTVGGDLADGWTPRPRVLSESILELPRVGSALQRRPRHHSESDIPAGDLEQPDHGSQCAIS